MRFAKHLEEEMLSFDAEAMRACVKYKLLKKYIKRCVKEVVSQKGEHEINQDDLPKESVDKTTKDHSKDDDDSEIEEIGEEDFAKLESSESFLKFMETVNEDLIAVNQYYNKEFSEIHIQYDNLYNAVKHSLSTKSFFSFCKRNPLPHEIFELYGRMELLKKFASLNYSGIRKIIKKMHKVTHSNVGDGFMKLVVASPFYNMEEQNHMEDMIQNLYYVSLMNKNIFSRKEKSIEMDQLLKDIQTKHTNDDKLKEISIASIEQSHKKQKGQEQLRDMVYRGKRVYKGTLPIRPSISVNTIDSYKDVMLVQMSLYPLTRENDRNEEEKVLKEGIMLKRNGVDELWHTRYYILTNKRFCYFSQYKGAIRRTIELNSISNLYILSTRLYKKCLYIQTKDSEIFWITDSDESIVDSYKSLIQNHIPKKIQDTIHINNEFSYYNDILQLLQNCDKQADMWSLLLYFEEILKQQKLSINEVAKCIEVIQETIATRTKIWSNTLVLMAINIVKQYDVNMSEKLKGKMSIEDSELVPTSVNISQLYIFEREIGSGHFSTVQLGFERDSSSHHVNEGETQYKNIADAKSHAKNHSQKHYAIKCINIYELTDYDRKSLRKEVGSMIRLRGHPNIVNFYGFYCDSSRYYIVMELAQGGRLFDYILKRKQFNEDDARIIMRSVTNAVDYCHDNNIIHRDLKPQNILLEDPNDISSILLSDFGFASHYNDSTQYLTTSLGTPGYTAPEVLKGDKYTKKVDIWSLGVITYIILCGYPPFPTDNEYRRLQCINKGLYTFDSPYWDDISQDAQNLIRHCICVDTIKRYDTKQMLSHPWLKNINPSDSDMPCKALYDIHKPNINTISTDMNSLSVSTMGKTSIQTNVNIKSLPSFSGLTNLSNFYNKKQISIQPTTSSSSSIPINPINIYSNKSFIVSDINLSHHIPGVTLNNNNNVHIYEDELYVNLFPLPLYKDDSETITKEILPQYSLFSVLHEDHFASNTFLVINSKSCSFSLPEDVHRVPLYVNDEETKINHSIQEILIPASKFYSYTTIPFDSYIYKYTSTELLIPFYLSPFTEMTSQTMISTSTSSMLNTSSSSITVPLQEASLPCSVGNIPVTGDFYIAIDSTYIHNNRKWGLLHSIMYKPLSLQTYSFIWILLSTQEKEYFTCMQDYSTHINTLYINYIQSKKQTNE